MHLQMSGDSQGYELPDRDFWEVLDSGTARWCPAFFSNAAQPRSGDPGEVLVEENGLAAWSRLKVKCLWRYTDRDPMNPNFFTPRRENVYWEQPGPDSNKNLFNSRKAVRNLFFVTHSDSSLQPDNVFAQGRPATEQYAQ